MASHAAGGSSAGGSGASTRARVACQALWPAPSRHATKSTAAPSLALSLSSRPCMTRKKLALCCLHRSSVGMQSGARQGCLQLLLHTKGHVSLHAAPCWPICSHPSPSNSLSKL